MDTKPLALTVGDPAGIGPEIIATWLRQRKGQEPVAVIGPATWLEGLSAPGLIRVPVGDASSVPGIPTLEGARIALAAMEEAASGTRSGRYAGVVTGPVSKAWLAKAGFTFPGQTEFFAARWGGEPTMGFAGGKLRVVLATWHVPLRSVSACLTQDVLGRAIRAAVALAQAEGVAKPRVAICGLNPHAGEEGLLGNEEQEWIDPFLDIVRKDIPGVSRTLPGDTVFGRMLKGEFDVIVAMYHDQGLAPLKVIDFDESVNVTLGLPWVRTSPDHGTAFSLAGKGVARATSFGNAVEMAWRLINHRQAR